MDPKHTFITYDMRPFKAAARHEIDECIAGRAKPLDAARAIGALAADVPGLDAKTCEARVAQRLFFGPKERAYRVIDGLGDRMLHAWVYAAAVVAWVVLKWAALGAFVWAVVWMATR